ncbi:MAG: acyltransferase [Candidatus Levyibacteriota bacterium]
MQNRLFSADLMRILAIYLIIVLHLAPSNYVGLKHPEGLIISSLLQISVPLFVMLSGGLLLGKSESYGTFFKKRFIRVVSPWIFWTTVFTFLIIFNNQYSILSFVKIFHSVFIPMFWLLPTLSGLYLLTPSLRIYIKHAKQKEVWLMVLLWFITVSILPYFRSSPGFPMVPDNGIVRLIISMLGYYILGYLITKLKPSKNNFLIFIILFLAGLSLSSLTYAGIIRSGDVSNISPGSVLLTISTFALFYFSEKVLSNKFSMRIKTIIAGISKATFGVYFAHYLFTNHPPLPIFLRGDEIHTYIWFSPFLNGMLIMGICLVIIFLLQKIPILGKYVT